MDNENSADADVKVRVISQAVDLYITLTPKFLAMPLSKALLNPFIKAYNKKNKDLPVTLGSLLSMSLVGGAYPDGNLAVDVLKDESVTSGTILGRREGVTLTLVFHEQTMPMATHDGMSEVEKLKARRRAENAAKRAAAAGDGGDAAPPADVSDQAPMPPTAPLAPPAEMGALGQLSKAEAKMAALEAEIAACSSELGQAADTAAVDAISRRVAACGGTVGQLQALMDEIDLGELDDEARTAARSRRKAINAKVEAELEPAKTQLQAAVKAARAKMG